MGPRDSKPPGEKPAGMASGKKPAKGRIVAAGKASGQKITMGRIGAAQKASSQKITMGRIGAAHGIRGEVRLQSFCADPADIAHYAPLISARTGETITITALRPAGKLFVAAIAGITDRTGAEKLNGTDLLAERGQLPEPADDEYYLSDLIGLEARSTDGSRIGTVAAVENYGAGDIIEIRPDAGQSLLFAFTRATVPEIDLDAGFLSCVPPTEVDGEEEK